MPTNVDHTDYLMTLDGDVESLTMSMTAADLAWSAYVTANRVNVAAFFKALKSDRSVTMHRAPATWEKNTSLAKAVIAFWSPRCETANDDVTPDVRAMIALELWNDERVSNGERPIWSLQNLAAKHCGAVKAKPAAKDDAKDDAGETDAADAGDAKTQLDVVLAAIPHLSAADLVVARDAIVAAMGVKAVA